MSQTREDRIENLSLLMPSVAEEIILYLATDNSLKPYKSTSERTVTFHYPLMEFFRKFRIDRKKLQRILHHCASPGADDVKASFWRWEQESTAGEANDMGSVAAVGRAAYMEDNGGGNLEEVTQTAKEVLTDGGKREPYLSHLDAVRTELILRCQSALIRSGRIRNLPMARANKILRQLVRKCEMDTKRRPPEYWVMPHTRQDYNNPNVVYADGKFGDGSEYYKKLDDNGRIVEQGRKPKVDPLIPEFMGLSIHEQNLMVAKLYQQRKDSQNSKKE